MRGKRQMTAAKRAREQAVQERRARKQERKRAAAAARSAETAAPADAGSREEETGTGEDGKARGSAEAEVEQGTVRWFDDASGYGFVVPDAGGDDRFVRRASIGDGSRSSVTEGQRVEFEPREGGMGPEAINVVEVEPERDGS